MASSLFSLAPRITSITLSQEELTTKQLTSHHLQEALEALHRDGIMVLNNAIPTSDLDALNARMVPEAKKLYARSSVHQISLLSFFSTHPRESVQHLPFSKLSHLLPLLL
jgi:hypothetical protein